MSLPSTSTSSPSTQSTRRSPIGLSDRPASPNMTQVPRWSLFGSPGTPIRSSVGSSIAKLSGTNSSTLGNTGGLTKPTTVRRSPAGPTCSISPSTASSLRKCEEKAPPFTAGMNPTTPPQTTFDVQDGCFNSPNPVLLVDRGGLPAHLLGQYRDSLIPHRKHPLSVVGLRGAVSKSTSESPTGIGVTAGWHSQ